MSKMYDEKRRLLVLKGSPYEMGRVHGELLRGEIEVALSRFLKRSLSIMQVPREFILEKAVQVERYIPEPYIEEIRGIAQGSGTPYPELLALNVLVDLDNVYSLPSADCCNFVVLPPAAMDGEVIHGRNLDFPHRGIIQRVAVNIIRRPTCLDALPSLAITWAGFVGILTGCNPEWIAATEVTGPTNTNTLDGVPIGMLLRNALESSQSTGEFVERIEGMRSMCAYNLAVSDGLREQAVAIEVTACSCNVRHARNGVLVVDNTRMCTPNDPFPFTFAAGAFRQARVVQLIDRNHGAFDASSAFELLRDRYDAATGVPVGKGYNCICNEHTVQSVLFLPKQDRLFVSHMTVPAPDGVYLELQPSAYWDV